MIGKLFTSTCFTLSLILSLALPVHAQLQNSVMVNGKALTPSQQEEYRQAYGTAPFPGNYWYDTKSGLFGLMGGPTMGTLNPGHDFGKLPVNASSGNTGVFVNGRNLPQHELNVITQNYGHIEPGYYWLDATGKWGTDSKGNNQSNSKANNASKQSSKKQQAKRGGGDKRLVGIYRGEVINSGTGSYINTQLNWVFKPDGTVIYGAQSHFSSSERDHNGNPIWTAGGQTGRNDERGVWTTSGNLLTINWQGGQISRYAYSFEPDGSLVYRNPHTRKLINFYPRIR